MVIEKEMSNKVTILSQRNNDKITYGSIVKPNFKAKKGTVNLHLFAKKKFSRSSQELRRSEHFSTRRNPCFMVVIMTHVLIRVTLEISNLKPVCFQ